jgi:hypothetical protein
MNAPFSNGVLFARARCSRFRSAPSFVMYNARNPGKKRGIEMTRLTTIVIPTLAFLTLSSAATLHAQVRQRPGMWESTITSHGKTDTRSSCVEPADAALTDGPEALLRTKLEKAASKGGVCTIKNFKLDGNTLIYAMVCGKTTTLNETHSTPDARFVSPKSEPRQRSILRRSYRRPVSRNTAAVMLDEIPHNREPSPNPPRGRSSAWYP